MVRGQLAPLVYYARSAGPAAARVVVSGRIEMGREMKGLFGGGDSQEAPARHDRHDRHDRDDREDREARRERRHRERDFVDRYTTGDPTQGYSAEEAVEQFRRVAQHASPEVLQRAAQQTMSNMTDEQRAEFGKMLEQRRAGQGMVEIERSGGGARQPQPTAGGGDLISDLFGGLLGGAAGGAASSAGSAGAMPDIGGL